MEYRHLRGDEIAALTAAGCRCDDWSLVTVADPFVTSHYRNVAFSGAVRLGTTAKVHMRSGAIPVSSGIYDALLHDCTVGNDVLIRKINNYICRYDIADDVIIENVGRLAMTGESTFGNGTEVSVLNETGGREVPIYDRLSAHVAYLLAMYRHDTALMQALRGMISAYVESRRSSRGRVETGARIINSGSLQNVYIGPAAVIDGASKLYNGSLMSEPEAPVYGPMCWHPTSSWPPARRSTTAPWPYIHTWGKAPRSHASSRPTTHFSLPTAPARTVRPRLFSPARTR